MAFDPTKPFLDPAFSAWNLPQLRGPVPAPTMAPVPVVKSRAAVDPNKRKLNGATDAYKPLGASGLGGNTVPHAVNYPQFNDANVASIASAENASPYPDIPATVANAVGYAQATTNPVQSSVRKAEKGSYNPATPGTPAEYGAGASTSPAGVGYTTQTTSSPSITRVNVKGQSPLYTNLEPGAALDDISKKGPQLNSVPGFLGGVKEGGFGLVNPAAGGANYPNPASQQAAQLHQQANEMISSGGLVDMWMGRGLRRQANTLTDQADAQGRLADQQQLTKLRQRQIEQQFELGKEELRVRRRGQDFGLFPNMTDILLGSQVTDALSKGEYERANKIATVKAPRTGHVPKGKEVIKDINGVPTHIFDPDTGTLEAIMSAEEQKKQALKQAAAKAEKK